jgi:heptosyltransferase-2
LPIPRVPRSCVSETALAELLERLGLTLSPQVAILCPGAEYGPAKRWPASYFAELARRLANDGHQVWIVGSSKDRDVGQEITRLSGGIGADLCGRTTLDQVVDLLSCARLVISNDSGLMHIAAALSVPLIALYGSSSPSFTPPLSEQAIVLKLDLPCSPCYKRVCPLRHFNCMVQLTPDRVYAAIAAR